MDYSAILPPDWIERYIKGWLEEDIPGFDVGAYIVGDKKTQACLYSKSPGLLAGVPVFTAIFEHLNCKYDH